MNAEAWQGFWILACLVAFFTTWWLIARARHPKSFHRRCAGTGRIHSRWWPNRFRDCGCNSGVIDRRGRM